MFSLFTGLRSTRRSQKGCSIVSVFWGDVSRREPARLRERMRQLLRSYEAGKPRPHIWAIERGVEALGLMAVGA
jgi:hypothetical protein